MNMYIDLYLDYPKTTWNQLGSHFSYSFDVAAQQTAQITHGVCTPSWLCLDFSYRRPRAYTCCAASHVRRLMKNEDHAQPSSVRHHIVAINARTSGREKVAFVGTTKRLDLTERHMHTLRPIPWIQHSFRQSSFINQLWCWKIYESYGIWNVIGETSILRRTARL